MTPQKTTYNLDTHVPTELHEVDAHVDTSHAESGSHGNGHHDGPHVLDVSPEATFHFDVFGMDIGITPIVITTWIYIAFMAIICIMFAIAFKRKKGKMFMTGFLMVRGFYHFFSDIIENKKFTQKVVFLLGGIFFYIITANIFSLMVEWLAFSIPSMHYYVRGINTDISTTLGLALTVIIVSHFVMIKHRGFGGYLKWYLFNFKGSSFIEKIVHVFIGWLHLIGEGIRSLSLSMRLFGNIFGGATLLAVIAFLTTGLSVASIPLGQILMLPFWLFELFVACVQALIFSTLAWVYFKEATEHH